MYQKKYHLIEPFNKLNYSSYFNESQIHKALLDPCSYQKDCQHCGLQIEDLLSHFLTQCPALSETRRLLQLKLQLYNFPNDDFPPQKNLLLKLSLNNTCWKKCLANFLQACEYQRIYYLMFVEYVIILVMPVSFFLERSYFASLQLENQMDHTVIRWVQK